MSFEHAPVTKGWMISLGLISLLIGVFDVKHYFQLQFVPHISRHHQYWRLITHHLGYTSSSDLFLGEILLYTIGVPIERLFGSIKFASFLFVSVLLSTLLEFTSLLLFNGAWWNVLPPGPHVILFSTLYQYHRLIPTIYTWRLFSIPLGNKSPVYFLAFQLAILHWTTGPFLAGMGWIVGMVYRSDLVGLSTYRIPRRIVGMAEKWLLPLVGSLRPPRRTNMALPTSPTREPIPISTTPRERTSRRRPQTEEPPETPTTANPSVMREWVNQLTGGGGTGLRIPTDQEISLVMSMFPTLDRQVVTDALQRSPNVQVAVDTLLTLQT